MGKSAARITSPPKVPPLRDGDRMTAAEFWRRYEADPHVRRAELIRGVVHIISEEPRLGEESSVPPISGGGHGEPHSTAIWWLVHYRMFTPGVMSSAPTTVRADATDDVSEPDAVLRILPQCGGQTRVDGRGVYHGAPELVLEVSHTSGADDLGSKFEAYQQDGAREYIVWRTGVRTVDWFRRNRAGRFVPLPADVDGVIRSRVFPGLWLNTTALVADDLRRMLATLNLGIASPEHDAFIEKLRRKGGL